jgi:phosphoenolpyruvate carboxykinase (GTP)
MADYWSHWFEMGEKLGDKAPKIFNVNWFRLDDDGHFIWPGFGDNLRVLEWIIDRCEGKVEANEAPIGFVPNAEDINLEGLDFSMDTLKSILEIDKDLWMSEAEGIEEFYKKFGEKLPAELTHQLEILKANLK